MPGRRYPRRLQQDRQSSHVRAVFRGGLDGASMVPYPVKERDTTGNFSKPTEVLFYNDKFYGFPGGMSINLTWAPIAFSEHVYVVRNGEGHYQIEKTTWNREPGSRVITIEPMMNVQDGDFIVVEYAYYDQAPEKGYEPN